MNQIQPTNPSQQAAADALFASIGEGAIATDEYGKITQINRAGEVILGFKAKELIGAWFPKKIVAVASDGTIINLIDREITQAFLTGKPVAQKMMYRRKNGTNIPVSVSISPILLGARPIGAIEVFRDITLEEEIDRMKSEFISLASHQLRTPLSAIKTYSHMLIDGLMGELTVPQKKSLRTIIGASNRMNELISTLLNITRIESGTIAVTPKMLQIDKVIDEVVKEVALLASEKSINLTQQVKGNRRLTIKTDSLILKEIVANLISNAIKYTPDNGSVTVTIKPRLNDIEVSISDTGWGIPEYAQDQIFSKFFRAHNIVKRETTGTGLGLYLVKGLLDRLGGKIWFESQEGKGTTFSFSLPRSKRKSIPKMVSFNDLANG